MFLFTEYRMKIGHNIVDTLIPAKDPRWRFARRYRRTRERAVDVHEGTRRFSQPGFDDDSTPEIEVKQICIVHGINVVHKIFRKRCVCRILRKFFLWVLTMAVQKGVGMAKGIIINNPPPLSISIQGDDYMSSIRLIVYSNFSAAHSSPQSNNVYL
mgnify:FL=1